jgi:hypothetical protein
VNEQLLTKIVSAFCDDPALLAYKGIDEPRNPREALRRGVFLRHDDPETIQVTPPLVASKAQCEVALEALDAGLSILDSFCTSPSDPPASP